MKKHSSIVCIVASLLISTVCEAQNKVKEIQYVVSHETTTGAAITFPVVVAIIALISSIFSIYISFRLKDKEYINDYYKKVIDKRIKFAENTEAAINLFSTNYTIKDSTDKVHTYFLDSVKTSKYGDAVDKAAELSLWASDEATNELGAFSRLIGRAIRECKNRLKDEISGEYEVQQYAISIYDEVEKAKDDVARVLSKDMHKLYDVEAFFKAKNI